MSVPKHFLAFRLLQLGSSRRSCPPRLLPPPRPRHDACAHPGVLRRCDVPADLGLLPLGRQPSAPERVSRNPTLSLAWPHHREGVRMLPVSLYLYSRARPAARARSISPAVPSTPQNGQGAQLCLWAGTRLLSTAEPGAAGTRWRGQPAPRPQNLLLSQPFATELPCQGYSRLREVSELLAL